MFPRWLSWLFVLLMAYLIYTGNQAQHSLPRSPADVKTPAGHELPNPTTSEYPRLQQLTNGNRWKRALNPNYVGEAKLTDKVQGHGEPAQCGAFVTIHLRGTLADGANFDPEHDETKPLTFALGNAPYDVLNNALIGMQEGGVRQITTPPQLVLKEGIHKTREDVLLRVEMDKVASTAPTDKTLGLKIYQDTEGTGVPASCGAPMKLTIKLWNNSGAIAYETPEPITIALGKNILPNNLASALNAMLVGETRTIMIPPENTDDVKVLPPELRKAFGAGHVAIITAERIN